MRFPELRWSPPRLKLFLRGWHCRHPLISEIFLRKIPCFEEGRRKKRSGVGGRGCVGTFDLFFFLTGKSKLPHPWGGGGGGGVGGH